MAGGGVEVCFSVVDGEGEEDGEDEEGEPDGEGDEDCVGEAGCWEGGGEGGVWALLASMLVVVMVR